MRGALRRCGSARMCRSILRSNITFPFEERDYRGRLTWHIESLFIVARTGYRPHLTRRLLVASIVAYVMLIAAVILWPEWMGHPPGGDVEVGVEHPPTKSLAHALLRWRLHAAEARVAAVEAPLADDDRCGGVGGRGGGGVDGTNSGGR